MEVHRHQMPMQVIGLFGEALSLADLPKNDIPRWVIRRNAEVGTAANGSVLTVIEACNRQEHSLEEFSSSQKTIDRFALSGLRVSYLSQYRTEGWVS
jgi:hypothetical protein